MRLRYNKQQQMFVDLLVCMHFMLQNHVFFFIQRNYFIPYDDQTYFLLLHMRFAISMSFFRIFPSCNCSNLNVPTV
jgi:hypothetical protein